MATQDLPNVLALIKELNWLGKNGDYEKGLKVANKIIQELPEDEKIFQCKIVCLIHLGKYEDALVVLKKNPKLAGNLIFEKAYSEYRLNRNDEAMKTIKSGNPDDPRLKELLGQLYYRLELYDESYDTYRDLIKNSADDFEDERETNLSAVVAALHLWSCKEIDDISLREETYELCYNAACKLTGLCRFQEAYDKLKQAEDLCKESFGEDSDVSKEEVDGELAIIWVQMGYVLQRLGRKEDALKLYNQVIKLKPLDSALLAVASNNIITINKDQNMFDSKKRIKAATSGDLKHKLCNNQKQSIAVNECLLHMYAGQADQCRKCASLLQQQTSPTSSSVNKGYLIESAQLLREKDSEGAIKLLQSNIEKLEAKEQDSLELKLALAQIYLMQEHVYKACDVLKTLGEESYAPGVISTLVTLYTSQEDKEAASEIINQAVEWYQRNKPDSPDLISLIKASSQIHLNIGKPQVAADMLEEMRRNNPDNLKILAQLILAYSKFDTKKAQEVSKHFPPIEELSHDIDLDSLESSANWFANKWVKKAAKIEASPRPPSKGSKDLFKKRHKKKKILPKNYDPNVTPDPERWLPMRERSYYRGKKKNRKKDIGKGTQGSVTTGVSGLDASESLVHSEVGSPKSGVANNPQQHSTNVAVNPNAPRQQKPAAAAKQKPKKKKGGKW